MIPRAVLGFGYVSYQHLCSLFFVLCPRARERGLLASTCYEGGWQIDDVWKVGRTKGRGERIVGLWVGYYWPLWNDR